MITKDTIKDFISNTLLEGQGEQIETDQDLLMSGVLDSLNVMKLALFLEEQCKITIPAHDVVLENFSTVDQMHAYLLGRGTEA